jgi:hypothetical protein
LFPSKLFLSLLCNVYFESIFSIHSFFVYSSDKVTSMKYEAFKQNLGDVAHGYVGGFFYVGCCGH